jgi:aldehyde:ferredoxin oxidoreductase
MYGWTGKILHVDLSNSQINHIPTQPYAERFLGGRGIASRLYWEKVTPGVGAFDPENRLIFMVGPLVATGVQGASRMSVAGKSPMTLPEGYCYGNIGGFVGAELKRAGFDGVVIDGRAPEPVYLWIHDSAAEILDASFLWGHNTDDVAEILQDAHGENVKYITTGMAGENRVRTAVAVASHGSAATGGWGAVMGSKNLKALAIRGTASPTVANPAELRGLNRYTVHLSKRLVLDEPPGFIGHQVVDLVRKGANCSQCGLECQRGIYHYANGQEGYRKCQAMEVYQPWRYGREDEPLSTLFEAPAMCDDYSICTWEVQMIAEWLYDCYQSGALSEEETGLPLSQIGTREFLDKLLYAISCREGFGDILAEGLVRAADRVPARAKALLPKYLAPIIMADLNPPRAFVAHALLYAMEPRTHMPLLHEAVFLRGRWIFSRRDPDRAEVTSDVFRNIARTFWGSDEAADLDSYEGKALAAKKTQDRTYIKDSLGLCDFAWPIMDSFNTPDHVGDPTLIGRLFAAVTGLPAEELDSYAERIFTMQRAIMAREGHKGVASDTIPEYNFEEPLDTDPMGREVTIPGPGDTAISTRGNMLDRGKYTAMLKEYYQLRGWDTETGLPRKGTLSSLGLAELSDSFGI